MVLRFLNEDVAWKENMSDETKSKMLSEFPSLIEELL